MKKYDDIEYQIKKEEARNAAIEWQRAANEKDYSYSELAGYSAYFEKIARRYGLKKEFRENGII